MGKGGQGSSQSTLLLFFLFFFFLSLPPPQTSHLEGWLFGEIGEKGFGRGLGEEGWVEKGPGRPIYQETICIDLNLQLPSSVNVCLEKGN